MTEDETVDGGLDDIARGVEIGLANGPLQEGEERFRLLFVSGETDVCRTRRSPT